MYVQYINNSSKHLNILTQLQMTDTILDSLRRKTLVQAIYKFTEGTEGDKPRLSLYKWFPKHQKRTGLIRQALSLLQKAMAPHSSTLAWKIPWTEEPGRLQSTGSQRVGHDWATSLSLFTFMHWRRKWHPTPVFSPGESQGQGSLVGCCLWGRTESDMTEAT